MQKSTVRSARPSRSARSSIVCAAQTRPVWLPGITPPVHLKGKLAGDTGFDPLGLGQSESRLKWYAEAEKTNGRWAMAAVAGILFQEKFGADVKWFEAGAKPSPIDLPVIAQLGILFPVLGFLETKRYMGFKETGSSGFINSFPFDPVGLNSQDMQTREVKNGRLAMVAFVGFAVQALVTRTGPIEGLNKHLSDPFGRNLTYYLTHIPEVLNGTA